MKRMTEAILKGEEQTFVLSMVGSGGDSKTILNGCASEGAPIWQNHWGHYFCESKVHIYLTGTPYFIILREVTLQRAKG